MVAHEMRVVLGARNVVVWRVSEQARDPTPIFQRPGALALSAASTPTIDRTCVCTDPPFSVFHGFRCSAFSNAWTSISNETVGKVFFWDEPFEEGAALGGHSP
jgi:hypothetical protein